MANAARSFRPTITETVTSKNILYAFGKAQKAFEGRLADDNPIPLKIQYNGDTMRIVGTPEKNEAPAAPKKKPNTLLQACIDAAGFEEHRNHYAPA